MANYIRGSLLKDYVRLIRKNKQVNWSQYLAPSELELIGQRIQPTQWYPLSSYQRLGSAVFRELAQSDPRTAQAFGRESLEEIAESYGPKLVKAGDPLATLQSFKTLSLRFLDFDGFDVTESGGDRVYVILEPEFGAEEIEAYSYQIMGFLERLVELTGAVGVKAAFCNRAWEGEGKTVIEVSWNPAGAAGRQLTPLKTGAPVAETKPPRIMVIDDDAKTCRMAEIVLKKAGYEVLTRTESLGSSAAIKEYTPDLVLLDLMMPGISGDNLAELIEAGIKPRPAILLHSNKSAVELKELVKKLGVEGFACKVDGPSALIAAVNRALGRSEKK